AVVSDARNHGPVPALSRPAERALALSLRLVLLPLSGAHARHPGAPDPALAGRLAALAEGTGGAAGDDRNPARDLSLRGAAERHRRGAQRQALPGAALRARGGLRLRAAPR